MNSNKTILDIIVPVYNTAKYLDKCIASIVAQTFTDWHLTLVDDGSTDGSPEICDRWASTDGRISVIHKPNTGQGDSRNVAIKSSTAELVGFVDSDDWIEPDMYATLIGELQASHADIAVCNHFVDYPKSTKYKRHKKQKDIEMLDRTTAHRLVIRDNIKSYIWQMVFRRECLDYNMPRHLCFEDYAVLPQWFDKAEHIVRINRPLYHYRMRRNSIVHTDSAERDFYFIEAEEQRMMFYKGTPFEEDVACKLLLTYIRTAKYIARIKDISTFALYKYLLDIRHRINRLTNNAAKQLSPKNRLLRYLLLNSISMFITYQRTEVRLMGNKHKEKKETYK